LIDIATRNLKGCIITGLQSRKRRRLPESGCPQLPNMV
jgi:hypothetical protein